MNSRARLARLESSIRGRYKLMDPEKINGLFHYLKTGEAARIPAGVSFPELQAAARRIPKAQAGKFRGLEELRAALTETQGGADILGYIEAGNPLAIKTLHIEEGKPAPTWPAADLLRRLGFNILLINSAVPRPRTGA